MAKFIFKLGGVLRQRANVEERRKRELAAIQSQMTALDIELRALDVSMRATLDDLRQNRLLGKIDLSFLAAHRRYSLSMQRKAMGIAEKMAAIRVQVDQAKKNLAEASKQKKILEKLRERQFARWRENLARKELAEMDEIGMRLSYQELAAAESGAE